MNEVKMMMRKEDGGIVVVAVARKERNLLVLQFSLHEYSFRDCHHHRP